LCKTGRSYFFAIKLLAYQKQPKWALYHKSVACWRNYLIWKQPKCMKIGKRVVFSLRFIVRMG